MFRNLKVDDGQIDNFLTKAFDKVLNEPGLTDEEMAFYKGASLAVEWMIDEDADEPDFETC